jgi:hypothetical protein
MSYLTASKDGYTLAEISQQKYINEMVNVYRRVKIEIEEELKDVYVRMTAEVDPDKYQQWVNKNNRLKSLRKKVTELYQKASKEAGRYTAEGLTVAMAENYNRQQYLMQWLVPELIAKPIDEKLLAYSVTGNVDVWKNIQSEAFEKIWGNPGLYSPRAGTLTSLLSDNATNELNKILQSIQSGFIQGKSYTAQAKEIDRIIGKYLREKGIEKSSGSIYNALRVARTEGQRVMNAGALANAYQSISQGLNVKKMWIASLDDKTRSSHIALDSVQKEIDKNFISPITGARGQAPCQMDQIGDNINCRCRMIEIVNDITPETRSAMNPVTGKSGLISFKSFNQWESEKR